MYSFTFNRTFGGSCGAAKICSNILFEGPALLSECSSAQAVLRPSRADRAGWQGRDLGAWPRAGFENSSGLILTVAYQNI